MSRNVRVMIRFNGLVHRIRSKNDPSLFHHTKRCLFLQRLGLVLSVYLLLRTSSRLAAPEALKTSTQVKENSDEVFNALHSTGVVTMAWAMKGGCNLGFISLVEKLRSSAHDLVM